MQPESSDGFASVGTILPEERAALLPGGSFRFLEPIRTVTLEAQWPQKVRVGTDELRTSIESSSSLYRATWRE
jgi:hypothetical protein